MDKSKTMTPKQIKRALDDVGLSQADIAEALGKSNSLVFQVIHNQSTSHPVRCLIAKAINRPVNELWDIKKNPTKRGRPRGRGLYDRDRQTAMA
ncbi:MAG: helix-turn-helix domain-containing protein [Desulfobacteraceae bacterium]|nr:helix-turn-helix domain-containing protein [Desulfobacteraceae bacterium]